MKIINAKVNWNEGWANAPDFSLLVDGIPSDIAHEERNGLFVGESGGFVSFYFYKSPGEGFGGRTFNILMNDGTRKDLHGPWSSNSMAVNGHFPEIQCGEVAITSSQKVWDKGHTFYAAAVSLEKLIEAAKMCNCYLLETDFGGPYYLPSTKPDMVTKPNGKTVRHEVKRIVYDPSGIN